MGYEYKKEGKFNYLEAGEGRPIIILHGLMGNLSNFDSVFEYFSSKGYKILMPELPIYKLPIIKTNVKNLAKFIKKFTEHKQLDNYILLGNSLGGHIAQVYALNNLENVNSLILTGSSGLFENSLGDGYPKKEDKDYIRRKTELTFFDPKNATDELVDEVFETVNNRAKAIRVVTMAKSAVRHNLKKELHKLNIPIKLIWGKNDTITPPFVAEEFLKLLPKASLEFINNCGHAAMMERPNTFNVMLMDFLTSLYKEND